MSKSRRFVAMTAASLVAVVIHAVAAQPIAAAVQDEGTSVKFSGEWLLLAPAFTDVPKIDLSDPMSPWQLKAQSTSLLYGDFVGIDHSTVTATYDPQTGWQTGWIKEKFVGTYKDGSTGTMTREGPYRFNLGTGEGRYLQEITGGDGDFEGAGGHIIIENVGGRPCVSCGTYDGVWDRPAN